MIIEGKRNQKNKEFMKIFSMWKSMMSRCYNKNNKKFHRYGGNGTTVDDRWHDLNNFIEDFDKIEGFDYELWKNGKLQLDKDSKQLNTKSKIYSLKTCKFMSSQENASYRKNSIVFYVVDLNGNILKKRNLEKNCREHDISTRHAYNMIKNAKKIRHVKGYQFFKEKPEPHQILLKKKHKAIKPDGSWFYYHKNSEITEKYNIPSYTI